MRGLRIAHQELHDLCNIEGERIELVSWRDFIQLTALKNIVKKHTTSTDNPCCICIDHRWTIPLACYAMEAK